MKEATTEDYETAWKDIWYHLIEMEHMGIDITHGFNSVKSMLEYHLTRAIITRKDRGMDYAKEGFDPNFKSIITGEPLWPMKEE